MKSAVEIIQELLLWKAKQFLAASPHPAWVNAETFVKEYGPDNKQPKDDGYGSNPTWPEDTGPRYSHGDPKRSFC